MELWLSSTIAKELGGLLGGPSTSIFRFIDADISMNFAFDLFEVIPKALIMVKSSHKWDYSYFIFGDIGFLAVVYENAWAKKPPRSSAKTYTSFT